MTNAQSEALSRLLVCDCPRMDVSCKILCRLWSAAIYSYTHICIHAYVYIWYMHTSIYDTIYSYTYICIYMYTCIHISTIHAYVYIRYDMSTYILVCMYIWNTYMYIYPYACIVYIRIHVHTERIYAHIQVCMYRIYTYACTCGTHICTYDTLLSCAHWQATM